MEKGVLRSENVFWSNENPPNLGAVTILGIGDPVAEVLVNNVAQAFRYDTIHKVKNRVVHAVFLNMASKSQPIVNAPLDYNSNQLTTCCIRIGLFKSVV
jgi:hypothetical protein